jgi:hypothetical protein
MPPNPRDARVVVNNQTQWTNKHQNFTQDINLYYDVWNPPPPVTDGWGDLRLTVAKLQSLINQAAQDNVRLRAYGGTWSLSRAAVTNGRLINTKPLNWWFPLASRFVSPSYLGSPVDLVFAQCGISVGELNDYLFERQRKSALKTSGASNGQTIVGAISTGTHGAATEVGAMQDFVVGMHLIVGPKRHVWLERSSYPVVSGELISTLGAELLRNDSLFNSAIVSFGSFGIIHGVLLETEPIYLLETYRVRMPVDDSLRRAMTTLDFTTLALPSPGEKPFHFEVVINPHDMNNGAYVTIMYKRPYRDSYTHPTPAQGGLGPGDDVLGVIGSVGDAAPGLVPTLVNTFVGKTYKEYTKQEGTPGEIFTWNTTHGKAMSTEIGLAFEQSSKALDCVLAAHQSAGPFGGLIAFRFVKKSPATLAFTRFPYTCTIELPGTFSNRSEQFFRQVWKELDNAGIPYTLHWGQQNDLSAARVRRMYGDASVNEWIQSRRTLLNDKMRAVFSSPFLESCGLG